MILRVINSKLNLEWSLDLLNRLDVLNCWTNTTMAAGARATTPPLISMVVVTLRRSVQVILSTSAVTICNVLTNTAAKPESQGGLQRPRDGPCFGYKSNWIRSWSINSGLPAPFDFRFLSGAFHLCVHHRTIALSRATSTTRTRIRFRNKTVFNELCIKYFLCNSLKGIRSLC